MRVTEVQTLYDYNYWAQERILRQVAHLSTAQYQADAGFSWGGVGGTLAHLLGTERSWRSRWQGTEGAAPTPPAFDTAAAYGAAWEENRAQMRAYLDTLRDDELDREVAYVRSGQRYSHALWTQLVHVVNHGTQHRGEIGVMLTNLGHSPGDIDFSAFMRQRGG